VKPIADAYELTPVQQGMLFHAQLDPAAPVYVVQLWTPLSGPLDEGAFHDAWTWAVARHPALRTGFVSEGLPRPMQIVRNDARLPWTVVDWRGLDAAEVEARRAALLADDRARPFNLAAPPLIRLTLARLADDEHVLFWTLHHLVLDGWSHTRVLGEVLARYSAGTAHEPPAPRPYRDFVAWLRARDQAAAETFWRAALDGVTEPTPLGIDGRGAGEGQGASEIVLEPALARELRARAGAHRVTLNTLFQGAWALVLSRYSGRDDVVFGATTAGRPESLAGADAMVGLFVNTLPVRAPAGDGEEVGAWLAALQARQATAREHEHSALVDVQGWTGVPRGRPLFESILAFENFPRVEGAGTGGLTVGRLGGVSRTGYPLTLIVHPGDDLVVKAYNDRARISDAAAGRLLGHLRAALESIARAAPGTRLGEMEIVPADERARLLAWGTGAEGIARHESIPERLAMRIAAAPDAVAAEYADGALTYAELDGWAGRIARRLTALGVRPGDCVGLATGQSAGMVAALAGILRAGAAVVPLDPEYPAERLAFMLADTGARALVTRGSVLAELAPSGVPVLDLATVEADEAGDPPAPIDPESTAYVIYTSGSTGRPKGVRVPHRAIVRTVVGSDHVHFGPATRMAQHANLAFDVAVWEVWGGLLNGGTVIGISRETLLSTEYGRELRDRAITTAFITPRLFDRHVRESPSTFATLRDLLIGGEAVDPVPVRAALRGGPPRRILNAYGPTECSVYAAWHLVADVADGATSVPIGRPLTDTRLYVTDRRGALAPAGVAGELCIGGARVAAGYLNRPALTAEKFVPDPFAPGARMYRTGDRARWNDDGTVDFLGRLDDQVKLRGFRVELGEIESVLRDHPAVAHAAVIVREDTPGDQRLVAYVVAEEGAVDAGELRAHLAARLPEYMVPAAFVALDALPINRNTKVDRAALPAPEQVAMGSVAPRDETEELLAALWAEVLGADGVGIHDSFFAAGGHSLQAMQLATRVREALRVEMPLRSLFEAPTVAGLAERLRAEGSPARLERVARSARLVRAMSDAEVRARLEDVGAAPGPTEAARRRELLDHFLRQEGVTAPAGTAIVPLDRESPGPLSFSQERLWVLEQLAPGTATYTIPAAIRMRGALDVDALRRALAAIVDRHDALRTTFSTVDGEPVATVSAAALDVPVVELAGDDALRAFAAGEAAHPFDLAAGPLFRATLVRLAADDHALVLVMHHAVVDGWSLAVLYRELGALYAAFRRGAESPLAPLPVRYADFAAWQRAELGDLERETEWWRGKLAGLPELLELPADYPRPAVKSYRGAVVPARFPAPLAAAVRALARESGATPFMALLAALAALLHRWTGAADFAVGTPTAGRPRPETEGLIGFFVNTLVVRADVAGDPTFRELLGRVREATLGAYAHQDVPFERLVDALRPERSTGHDPFFSVMLALQNAGELRPRLEGLEVERMQVPSTGARADLSFSLVEDEDGLSGLVEYSTDLFERATAERMLEQFRILLEAATAHPDTPVSALPLLAHGERAMLLEEWSGAPSPFPRERIDRIFARQAAATPDAVALAFDGGSLTYRELDERATRLAHHLRSLGVVAGTRVGVCLERSPEMIVATLAVLRAGGAYVPLDPAYPPERLAFMLADTAAPVLVTDERLAASLPRHGAATVFIDRDVIEPTSGPIEAGTDAEAVAYVMYTSGSTGQPKGIEIPHRAVARLVRGTNFIDITPDDVFLQMSPASFDAATLEIWGALLNGARLALYPPEAPSVEGIERAVATHRISVLCVPVGLFHLVVDERIGALRGVRHLFVGGDVLSADHARRVVTELPGTTLTNGYGPTENTTFTATHRVSRIDGSTVPIGKPIANTRVYVLDRRMEPVPVGVPGELFAGGDGLAHGYLHRPGLTAERFVPDPFTSGSRLYATGDRVCWRADGTLEFLGRVDTQVKIRGFRIEPGEIENVLRSHPAVRDAAVVARANGDGKRLVAYVVGEESDDVRAFLAGRLPEYMQPSAIVWMDALPLTPNGKTDRAALPEPEWSTPGAGHVAPRTATEEALATLWSEVLGAARVGARDDFFALGGHSLRATQLVSRVRGVFGVELPVRALFEAPTLAELAARVDAARGVEPVTEPVRPVARGGALALSSAQRRLWFVDQLEPGSSAYNVPVILRLRGALDVPALERALGGIVRRHEALRTAFATVAGQPAQVIAPSSPFVLSVETLAEEDAMRRAGEEAAAPFDLARGPLFRARLLRVAPEDHLLLLTMHHVAADGWSMGVFFRELAALYAAPDAELPSLPVQYADFAAWQNALLDGGVLQAQLGWWRRALDGAPGVLEIPTDRPRPATPSRRGGCERVVLPPEVGDALRLVGRRRGATLFMTILAAYQAVLARCSGQDDVVVGTPIAGRTRWETEGLIGLFVNTLALRGDVSGDPTFAELLARVRETTLGAYAHQDLPFERLVEEVQPERSLRHHPVFQAFFVLQNAPDERPDLAGLQVERVAVGEAPPKFDLALAAAETDDGVRCSLHYDAELFDPATARRILGQLAALLAAAAAEPERRLSELPLLPAEERELIDGWRSGPPLPERVPSFAARFAAHVRENPDAVALVHGAERISYVELDARAARLASRLARLGVRTETRVGVCLPRTPELVVALLAIAKTGGAAVTQEPHFPPERIASVLRDSGAALVIGMGDSMEGVPSPCPVLRLDDPSLEAEPSHELAGIEDEAVAAVLYTSGSTGKPKGVMVRHGSVAAFLAWMGERFPLAPGDRVLGATSVCFDVHLAEIHHALAGGGTLVLVENAMSLAELPAGTELAQVAMVPTAARELLTTGRFPAARRVLLGGEPVPAELAEELLAAGVGEVHNLYGPTEDTTYSTHARLVPGGRVTLGRAIGGGRAYVLDARLRPVPVGVIGEIHVAGRGVGRGYLGAPGLTAARFIPDPFGAPGERMYATGDRARWLPTGELESLGRADFQVKVRGFRVEPGEVESVLRRHPAVADAVVAARGEGAARRLVAWVASAAAPLPAELAEWVAAHLPAYMVPGVVVMDAFPRTVSGKIDRASLPEPAAAEREYVAPRTATESGVAEVWAEVLGVERAGPGDDFFALGGHSLGAMHAWGRIRERFHVDLPLRALFEHPGLADLARAIDAAPPAEEAAPQPITARARTRRAVLVAPALAEVGDE
jgi:amino acid adenylation domain-containing protein